MANETPLTQEAIDKAVERFWTKVNKSGDCWLWTLSPTWDGYGRFKAFRRDYRAHIFIWEALYGKLEKGIQVLHHCDVRLCVRPDHLHSGTHIDNMAEMAARARAPRGSKNPASKLTEDDVRAIRDSTEPQRVLARKYGVCQGAISHARLGRNWKSLAYPSKPYTNQSKGIENHG